MNKISTLAKSFRKNASGEAQRINTDLQSGLKQLESDTAMALKSSRQSLLAALKDNEKAMSEAIGRSQKALLWAYRWPAVLLIILALALTAWSGWQGVKLREQWAGGWRRSRARATCRRTAESHGFWSIGQTKKHGL